MIAPTYWYDIAPEDATGLWLAGNEEIVAPRNESGRPCPWPWLPQQITDERAGTSARCPYCRALVIAGVPHLDYARQET